MKCDAPSDKSSHMGELGMIMVKRKSQSLKKIYKHLSLESSATATPDPPTPNEGRHLHVEP